MKIKAFRKRRSIVIGIVLRFLYTWTINLSNSGVLPLKLSFAVLFEVPTDGEEMGWCG
jgi:hypothetical protein